MIFLKQIYPQFALTTLLFIGLLYLAFLGKLKEREPRRVLTLLLTLNVLRFGGVAGALSALSGSREPAFLMQVALGDGVTAALAVVALALLLRKSGHARRAALSMNLVGLAGILVSETWLGYLELTGRVTRTGFIHGPTIGAGLYTALHLYIFYFCARFVQPKSPARFPANTHEKAGALIYPSTSCRL